MKSINNKIMLIIFSIFTMFFIISDNSFAQEEKKEKPKTKQTLKSENLELDSKNLDEQILDYSKKIQDVVAKYEMLKKTDVRTLPYQFDYELGKDFIKIERHVFIRSGMAGPVIGLKRKSLKIYTNGTTVSKFESEISERNYDASAYTVVKIVDPSPTVIGTEDVTFTHINSGRFVVKNKPMKDIKNSTAFPVRNDIRRDFYVPHLNYFYNSFLNIAETYFKSFKDVDSNLNRFLKKSTKY